MTCADSASSASLIAHVDTRWSTLEDVQQHPFFSEIPWPTLRDQPAPFVPALDNDLDTGYYDDFSSPDDMAKYTEVKEKQRNVDRVREKDDGFGRGVWVGFTFGKNGPGKFGGPPVGLNGTYDQDAGAPLLF